MPIALAGLTHVAIIKLGTFKTLASIPLDLGATVRGRRVFGENKTVRGAVVMLAATAFWTFAQNRLLLPWGWSARFSPAYEFIRPVAWGLLAGAGYVAGELPNSFVKRQLGVGAGAAARGALKPIFWIVDQVDSAVGVLVFLLPVWRPNVSAVMALFGVTLLVHPAVALVMLCLGLKRRIG
jgi:CDP-diglyceride synthetase